jgi:uncharacterized protein (DUF2147 family)
MKRLCCLVVLTLLSSSALADSISFSVGGHRIRIEAPRNCRSSSCASVSVSGLFESRHRRDRFDDDDRDVAPPSAPAQASPPPSPPPVSMPIAAPVASVPAVGFKPAATETQLVAPPPPPPIPAPKIASQPCIAVPTEKPLGLLPPPSAPAAQAPVVKVLHEEEPSSTPVGDWQTAARGGVRIAPCGRALCGYAINASSNDKGEAVLINMKPKTDSRWTGRVYSRDSGDTFYGSMEFKAPNTLRVEACAFGRFYCTGNNWTRINGKTEPLITSRQATAEPRS